MEESMKRDQLIVRTSIIGIVANLFLAAFKAAVGLLSHSIAVTLDAVNNLSVITIIGTKIANRQPDKKHPLGHGRTEYLSAMIVAAIVLYAGVTSLVESIKKIIRPETPDYSVVSLIIIASAVVVKLLLGRYVKAQGQKANSGALIASGEDARFDAILSASVLAEKRARRALEIVWGGPETPSAIAMTTRASDALPPLAMVSISSLRYACGRLSASP